MKITNAGRSVHSRELKGVERFKAELPAIGTDSQISIFLSAGKSREIDVVLVTERRIFLIDLKDWCGKISSVNGWWYLNGKDKDASPVAKITDVARALCRC